MKGRARFLRVLGFIALLTAASFVLTAATGLSTIGWIFVGSGVITLIYGVSTYRVAMKRGWF